ncbi:MAG TPA: flagellin [Opitutaceae bacterium]|nr:flagellin [Opitutaceae bacterium]
MRIATQSITSGIISQLQDLSSRQTQLQGQVSTGQRITQAEDDPAAMGRVLTIQNQRNQIQQYKNNADQAMQVSQATYAGLQSIKKLSDRAGELATLGASVQSSSSYQAYATEINQLIEQGLQTANTQQGANYIYGGTATSAAPFSATRDVAGNITAVTYNGSTAGTSIPLSSTSNISPGTDGTTNQQLSGFLNNLVSLRNALQSGNSSTVSGVQTALHTSEDNIVNTMSEQGAVQLRIQVSQDQLTNDYTNLQKLISNDTDADMSTTLVQLNQSQTAYQAALQSSASIMKVSLLDYIK